MVCVLQTLAEILSERETICHLMEHILDEATRPWGVKVERVEIKVNTSKENKRICRH
jgi:regulator of protease activity HflC (stomatin/prohibitin superfamily)